MNSLIYIRSNQFTISNQINSSEYPKFSFYQFSDTEEFQSFYHYASTILSSEQIISDSVNQTFSITNIRSSLFSRTQYFSNNNISLPSVKMTSNFYLSSSIQSQFQNLPYLTYSKTFVLTFLIRKSVSFSLSCSLSNFYSLIYIPGYNSYSFIFTQSDFYYYFPYIIYTYSPSYLASYIQFSMIKKKGITKEQLIGISCASASMFFLIVGIIIIVIKRNQQQSSNDFWYLSDSSIDETRQNKNINVENETEHNVSDSTDLDLDFWL